MEMKHVLLITLLSLGLIACKGENGEPLTEKDLPQQGIEGLVYLQDYDYIGGPVEIPITETGLPTGFVINEAAPTISEYCGRKFYKSSEGKIFGAYYSPTTGEYGSYIAYQLGKYEYDWEVSAFQTLAYQPAHIVVVGNNVAMSSMSSGFQDNYGDLERHTEDNVSNCMMIIDEANGDVYNVNLILETMSSIFP